MESAYPQGVARTSLEREDKVTRGEYAFTRCGEDIPKKGEDSVTRGEHTSTRCGEDIHTKGEDNVTRGEYTSAGCGGDIPGKGEDNVAREESGAVGDRVVKCARSCIEEVTDGVPRANICTSRRGGTGQGTIWERSGDT